jgi:hypothetical protein
LEAGARKLIHDLNQIELGPCGLQHCNACRPQRFKIIWGFACSGDDRDRSAVALGWCGDHRINIRTG